MKNNEFNLECVVRSETIAASSSNLSKPKTFEMLAYSGGLLRWPGRKYPLVLNVKGGIYEREKYPILLDHDEKKRVGHMQREGIRATVSSLFINGVISAGNQYSEEVVTAAKNGFDWQGSVGVLAAVSEFIPAGESGYFNGQEIQGPFDYAATWEMQETSFVSSGADFKTKTKISASKATNYERIPMKKELKDYLLSKKFTEENVSALSEEQVAHWTKEFEADSKAPDPTPQSTPEPVTASAGSFISPSDLQAIIAQTITQTVAETTSAIIGKEEIKAMCGGNEELYKKAVENKMSKGDVAIEIIQASRGRAPSIHVKDNAKLQRSNIEASLCLRSGISPETIKASYGEKALDEGDKLRSMGLKDFLKAGAMMEGKNISVLGGDTELVEASYSSAVLPNMLENIGGKVLLDSYSEIESIAHKICKIGSVKNKQKTSRVRLSGTGFFEEVGEDGELKHAAVSDEKYEVGVKTSGQLLMITRDMMINDDIDGILELLRQMGQQGRYTVEHYLYSRLLQNSGSYFSAGNGNLLSGAEYALGEEGLSSAWVHFCKKKRGPVKGGKTGADLKDMRPINATPTMLMTSVEQQFVAERLINSTEIRKDGEGTKNVFHNKVNPLSAVQLSDSEYYGSEAAASTYYLLADPRNIPWAEVTYLKGMQRPTLERVQAPHNILGTGWKCYIDADVNLLDPRGILKVKGTG